jgi:hypothetical protein
MEELTRKLMERLDALEALVPELVRPHPSTRTRVRAQRTVPRSFIASLAAVVERNADLQRLGRFDPDEARDALRFEDEMRPVMDRVAALLSSLTFTVESRKATAASGALRTYAVAKALARDPSNAELAAALPYLRRDLGHGRPRRKAASGAIIDQAFLE